MLIDPYIGLVTRNCLPLLSAHECQEATRHVASKAIKLDATAKKILVFLSSHCSWCNWGSIPTAADTFWLKWFVFFLRWKGVVLKIRIYTPFLNPTDVVPFLLSPHTLKSSQFSLSLYVCFNSNLLSQSLSRRLWSPFSLSVKAEDEESQS